MSELVELAQLVQLLLHELFRREFVESLFELGRLDEGSSSSLLDAFEEELSEELAEIGTEPRSVFLEDCFERFVELRVICHAQGLYASHDAGLLLRDVPRPHVHRSSIFGLQDGSIRSSSFYNPALDILA